VRTKVYDFHRFCKGELVSVRRMKLYRQIGSVLDAYFSYFAREGGAMFVYPMYITTYPLSGGDDGRFRA
jgi:hypothetical protein